MQLIRAFGPALAVTVLTAMLVSLTLAPALIGIFGSALYWPGPRWFRVARKAARRAAAAQAAGGASAPAPRSPWTIREAVARFAAVRPVALVIVAVCVLGLLAAALDATGLRLGAPLVAALPGSTQQARAQTAAAHGFAVGIMSPTEILLLAPGVGHDTAALGLLQALLAKQPGVAGVVGPATVPAARRRPAFRRASRRARQTRCWRNPGTRPGLASSSTPTRSGRPPSATSRPCRRGCPRLSGPLA